MIADLEHVEFFNFPSTDQLNLSGLTYTPNPNSNKWVVSLHWYAGDKFFGLYHALFLTKLGYNVISFDFRGHAKSQKSTTTMGVKETRDVLGALAWLKANKHPEQVVLLGTSMGAYITNYLSFKHPEIKEEYNVKFGIADCGFGSIESLYMHERNIYLRFIPKRKTKQRIDWLIKKSNKVEEQAGVNLFDGNVFKLIEQGVKPSYPIFFNHAKNDLVTPPFDTVQLARLREDLIEGDGFQLYNYCMHTQALRTHFKTHVKTIGAWVAQKDENQTDYQALVKEWKLDDFSSKKDQKDQALS